MTAAPDLYLPTTALELVEKVSVDIQHPGIRLDKLSWAGKQEKQFEAIDMVGRCARDHALLVSLFDRRGAMLDAIGARRFCGRTKGALTLHLSRANALENAGLALHPVYGFAWLPGTGLKGMTRAWVETVWQKGESDQLPAKARIDEAFGTPDQAGRIIFHDAWPIQWPQLKRDILNSHHSDYYRKGKRPGDWEKLNPVYFLTVAEDTEFEFALSDRNSTDDGLLEHVAGWMCAALEDAGVGAKTAAGYGRIVPSASASVERSKATLPSSYDRQTHRLTLASPAFLAGAEQEQFDCDLRPASLRGLLRWWWRTMHAEHLKSRDLAKLEALIWGDTQRGSAVSLSLRAESTVRKVSTFSKPKDEETDQGLYYVSYGMYEPNRWYRHPGESWNITLIARETHWATDPRKQPDIIPVAPIMRQVEAALWLLARFGGVGSKGRKGFGSFEDVSVTGIDSVEDCIKAGQELRDLCCGGTMQIGTGTGTPALERRVGPVEIRTPWKDHWYALDRFGVAYQRFVKDPKYRKVDRKFLGLPRANIKGGKKEDRLASPLHSSLSVGDNKCLTIRLIAFPGCNPTTGEVSPKSKKHLGEMCEAVERELNKMSREKGLVRQAPSRGHTPPPRQFKSGQEIQAELLDEKTKKKCAWMAKDLQTGIKGNIVNNNAVPPDVKPGQVVSLFVQSTDPNNASFLWPTTEVRERLKRSATRNRQRGKGRR